MIKYLYMSNLIFLDTETTGNEEKDFLCQLAYKSGDETFCELFLPPLPIPPEASAITHITNKMVAGKPAFKDSEHYKRIKSMLEDNTNILVAHNAKFDVGMIKKENINPRKIICTLRVARALDKENKIPQYKLQYLRYYLDLDVEAQAHDALGDVLVLEQLFIRLFKKMFDQYNNDERVIEEMLEISARPSLMNIINFGKHISKTVEEVSKIDRGYLEWLLAQKESTNPDNEEDWIYTLRYYLGLLV